MTSRIVAAVRGGPARVGTAWVLSRHLLVAQAVAFALEHQRETAHAVPWGEARSRRDEMDPRVDVVVVIDDLDTPGAVEDIAGLVRDLPARVVVLTAHPATHVWGGLFDVGVAEVISSTDSLRSLADAVTKVAAGVPLMADADREVLRDCWTQTQAEEEELIKRLSMLSPRERRVLELLANGQRVASIETELGVSQSTVRSQVKSLRRKLGVDSQLGAVAVLHRMRGNASPQYALPGQRCAVD
ncbi:MAG: LuxR C-terminal-related transcriptional regulator [Nocardioides sp.]|nr:LuxR C-terminal-related transcriptional regulator [Nocardioides sp.]